MDLKLTHKVAAITGGSRGLGLASARALLAEGCHVAICARGAERLHAAVRELQSMATAGSKVIGVTADLSTAAGVTLELDNGPAASSS